MALRRDLVADLTRGVAHRDRAHAGRQGRLLPTCEDVAREAPTRLDAPMIFLEFAVFGDERIATSLRDTLDGLDCRVPLQ